MNNPCAAVARSVLLLMSAALANTCGGSDFPATPTPVASSPTVQQGTTYQGDIVLPDGATSSFNMTLIARGLAQHTASIAAEPPVRKDQFSTSATIGAVEVSGNYQTGRGLKGAVQGTLDGSLADGKFSGTLTTDRAGCSEERRYSGRVTSSGVAWLAGERLRTCPANELSFSVQIGQPHTSPCRYDPSTTRVSFDGTGGTGTVTVTAPGGCPWLAESPEPWVTNVEPPTGVGDGTIDFRVLPNPGSSERQASLRIAGRTVTVDQGPACSYSILPMAANAAGSGGRGTIAVTAPARCPWEAVSRVDWIAVSPTKGSANGTVTFTVAANAGPDRQGIIQIADRMFTVLQGTAPPQCTYAIAPSAASLGPSGGNGTVAVTAPPGCTWNAQTSASWLTILGSSSGSGLAAVSYFVQPNGGAPRTATAQIAGQVFTVTQSSLDCAYTITPSEVIVASSDGKGTVAINAPAGCAWNAQTSVDWITILGPPAGTGPGTVSYAVQPNQGAARTGTAQIAGQTFTVNQLPLVCTFSISPTSVSMPRTGGTGTVVITTQSGCMWTAQPLVDWIAITNVSAGAGKNSVTYSVAENSGASRTGVLQVAGQMLTVTQEGGSVELNRDRGSLQAAGARAVTNR
jgi:Viral BACON domain/Putative binding domain, N-terminal